MEAKSTFLIRVNDKNEAHRISEIANIVRVALGKKNALILFENEKPI